jgi:RNA recognition motif-containing protein
MQKNGYKNRPRPSPYWRDRNQASNEEGEGLAGSESQQIHPMAADHHVNDEDQREKKFGNRARLYVGNLPRVTTEDDLMTLFTPFGEIRQVYIEKEKNFGFVRLAYRKQAVNAISALNGTNYNGKEIRVRLAASSCSVKVSNLHGTVSNELLYHAFSQFGEVEFAVVVIDERGRSLGYGIVDFAKKNQALTAIDKCKNGCFFLTRSPIPVTVDELVRENEEDGLGDRQIMRNSQYNYERELPPRMAMPGTPEYNFGMRFKELYENEKKAKQDAENHFKELRKQLETEMEQLKHANDRSIYHYPPNAGGYQMTPPLPPPPNNAQQQHNQYYKAPPTATPMMQSNNLLPPPPIMPHPHVAPPIHRPLATPLVPGMMPPPQPLMPPTTMGTMGNAPRALPPVPPYLLPSPVGQV